MSHGMWFGRFVFGALLCAMLDLPTPAAAAMPGCFSGVWMVNEALTMRGRPQRGLMVFIAPWGENGWIRVSGIHGLEEPGRQSAEYHFITWDNKVYPIFGSDPRYTRYNRVRDLVFESESIREEEPARNGGKNIISFTADCKRSTWDSDIIDGNNPVRKDIRVYDKILGHTPTANDFYYGGWILNRQASRLTRPPMEEETVVIVPGGQGGWAYLTLSGSYQPIDFKKNVALPTNPENRPQRDMYWARWDGTPAYTYGYDPAQIILRKVGDRSFTTELVRIHQPWQKGDKGTIVFSNDGKRMTQTRSGVTVLGVPFENDVRVYDKVEHADWPGNVRVAAPR